MIATPPADAIPTVTDKRFLLASLRPQTGHDYGLRDERVRAIIEHIVRYMDDIITKSADPSDMPGPIQHYIPVKFLRADLVANDIDTAAFRDELTKVSQLVCAEFERQGWKPYVSLYSSRYASLFDVWFWTKKRTVVLLAFIKLSAP